MENLVKEKVKITVIMPSLNVASYIEESVRSVMNQTLNEIEILCIDAGSIDGTLDILNSLSQEDSRIKIIRSDIKSYGYQVNIGIHESRGEYISIIETDDFISSDMLAVLYKAAIQNDADIAKCDYQPYWTTDEGERFLLYRRVSSNKDLYDKVFVPDFYDTVPIDDWYLWNGIYKKEFILNNHILLSESLGAAFQDIGFLCQVNHYSPKTIYIAKAFYCYCTDRGGSSSNSGKGLLFAKREYEKILDNKIAWETKDIFIRMMKSFCSCMREISDLYVQSEEIIEAYYWFKSSLLSAITLKTIGKNDIPYHIWELTMELLTSLDEYQEELKKRKENVLSKLKINSIRGVLIFGCGDYGHNAYVNLKERKYKILGFIDNNPQLQRIKIDNLSVYSLDEAFSLYKNNVIYLVANDVYHKEISKQLVDAGIDRKAIEIWQYMKEI